MLELLELNSNDEIAKAVESTADNPADSSQQMHELERLAAASTSASRQSGKNSITGRPESKLAAAGAGPTFTRELKLIPEESFRNVENANTSTAIVAPDTEPVPLAGSSSTAIEGRRQKRRPHLVLAVLITLFVITTGLFASYITRQPRPLYAYLHRRGWDRTLDKTVRRVIDPAVTQVRKWLPR